LGAHLRREKLPPCPVGVHYKDAVLSAAGRHQRDPIVSGIALRGGTCHQGEQKAGPNEQTPSGNSGAVAIISWLKKSRQSSTPPKHLSRTSHLISTAAAHPGMSTLRSVGLLDVLSSTPAGPSVARRLAKRRIQACLRRLVAKPGEKCGLENYGACSQIVNGL
jgi:hypothetical protein